VRQHIDQSAFDLAKNTPCALRSHNDPAIQALRIDPGKLQEVATQMREKLIEFAERLKL
jgi:hypothetical protein